jgi:cell division protein FtsL
MGSTNLTILKRIFKLVIFFGIIFTLLFCITWQNIHMYLMKREIDEIHVQRNELERSIYLINIELSTLKSRERMKKIATMELDMIPVTYRDIKLIVY